MQKLEKRIFDMNYQYRPLQRTPTPALINICRPRSIQHYFKNCMSLLIYATNLLARYTRPNTQEPSHKASAPVLQYFFSLLSPSKCTCIISEASRTRSTCTSLGCFGGLQFTWYIKDSGHLNCKEIYKSGVCGKFERALCASFSICVHLEVIDWFAHLMVILLYLTTVTVPTPLPYLLSQRTSFATFLDYH